MNEANNMQVLATSSASKWFGLPSPSTAEPLDEFFVFAGKVYRRSRDDLYTPSYRRQQKLESAIRLAFSLAPLLAIAGYVWSSRLMVPLSKNVQQQQGKHEDDSRLARSAKQGEKIIFPSSGYGGILLRYQLLEEAVKKTLDTTTLVNRADVAPFSLESQLHEISKALASLSTGSKATKPLTEEEFEILRATVVKQRAPKIMREEILKLQSRMMSTESNRIKAHPLAWAKTSKYNLDHDIVELAASLAIPISAMSLAGSGDKCSRCGSRGESVAPLLSQRRHSAFFDLASRDWFDEDLERLVWLIIRSRERPEEVFLAEDPIRVVEPPGARWHEIHGASWQHDFLFSDSFSAGIRYFPNREIAKLPADTLVRTLESCLLPGSVDDETKERLIVSCAVVDSSRSPRQMYAFRGVRFDRYDLVVDISQRQVYFNNKTYCGRNERVHRIALAMLNGLGTDRFALASRSLRRNSTALKTLLGSQKFSETWVCTIPASCIAQADKTLFLDQMKKAIRKELGIPSHSTIGCCIGGLSDSPQVGTYSLNDFCVIWISPMVPPLPATSPDMLLGEDVASGLPVGSVTTALVFVKDRAFCGCKIQQALQKACM